MIRFHLPGPAPRDSEIIARATRLTIDLYCDKDGDLHGSFAVGGGVGVHGNDDDTGNDADLFRQQQASALRFVKKLLESFERKRGDVH